MESILRPMQASASSNIEVPASDDMVGGRLRVIAQ